MTVKTTIGAAWPGVVGTGGNSARMSFQRAQDIGILILNDLMEHE
jgi:hypothetical protein